jgi:hypothetical protein
LYAANGSDRVWINFPFCFLIIYSSIIGIPAELYESAYLEGAGKLEEAAAIDGASVFQRVSQIVIPLSIHGIIATAIFVTIFAWKEYMIAYIFTGTSVRTAPLVLYEMLSPVTGVSWGPCPRSIHRQGRLYASAAKRPAGHPARLLRRLRHPLLLPTQHGGRARTKAAMERGTCDTCAPKETPHSAKVALQKTLPVPPSGGAVV